MSDDETVLTMPRPSLAKLHSHHARAGIERSLNSLTISFQKTAVPQMEPPFQRKRRTPGPPVTLSTDFYVTPSEHITDEFVLLGNQEKFHTNVVYPTKTHPVLPKKTHASRDVSPPKVKKVQSGEDSLGVDKSPNKTTPAPVVHTKKFQGPVTPLAPREPKSHTAILKQAKDDKQTSILKRMSKTAATENSNSKAKLDHEKSMKSKVDKENINMVAKDKILVKGKPDKNDVHPTAQKERTNKFEKSKVKPISDPRVTHKLDSIQDIQKSIENRLRETIAAKYSERVKDGNLKVPRAGKKNENKGRAEIRARDAPKKDTKGKTEVMKKDREKKDVKGRIKTMEVVPVMNEYVQTNIDDGVMDSGREVAETNHALRRKAGLAPSRPKERKRQSEYQRQFEWKNLVKTAPMIDAEKMIYNRNPQVAPFKTDSLPKVSEYSNEFKPWPISPPDPIRPGTAFDVRERMTSEKREGKLTRSKSVDDLKAKQKALSCDESEDESDDDADVKKHINKRHGKLKRRTKSEYQSNFQAPWKFTYLEGAWHGAHPPHIIPSDTHPSDEASSPTESNWFAEVRQLRVKAEEYRKRGQGTHFSRDHLMQLMASQTELWDRVSSASSTTSSLSALSLESPAHSHRSHGSVEDQREKPKIHTKSLYKPAVDSGSDIPSGNGCVAREPLNRKLAWTEADDEEEEEIEPKLRKAVRQKSKRDPSKGNRNNNAIVTSAKMSELNTYDDYDGFLDTSPNDTNNNNDESSEEGRIPTPKLLDKQLSTTPVKRHHLDLTTPSVGGAMLTSPPQDKRSQLTAALRKKFKSGYSSVEEDSDADDDDTIVDEPIRYRPVPGTPPLKLMRRRPRDLDESPERTQKVVPHLKYLTASPTFGVPSRDNHDLRDEEASSDRPLITQFVHNPELNRARKGIASSGRTRPAQFISPSKRAPVIPPTLDERMAQTYNVIQKPPPIDTGSSVADDDDTHSLSMCSITSITSQASELLERAQKRRDEFWG